VGLRLFDRTVWVSTASGGRPAERSWLPGQSSVPSLPVYTVHSPRLQAGSHRRTV